MNTSSFSSFNRFVIYYEHKFQCLLLLQVPAGDICVSLRYVAASALLNVVILEAKNLPITVEGDDPGNLCLHLITL